MFDFFKIVYDSVFVCQLLAVSFSLVLVFYDWKKNFKSIAIGALYIFGIFAVSTVLNWLLFELSTVWRGVAGIHFQIAWLLTIAVYLLLFDKTYVTSRFIMGATVFITAITMAEFGHELAGYSGARFKIDSDFICYLSDLFIVAFGLVIYKYTLKDYSAIPVASVIMIAVTTIVSTTLIIVKTVSRMKQWNPFDWYYCVELAGIYVISVASYLMVYYNCKIHKEATMLAVQNKMLDADRQRLEISEKAIEEMRALRHDMKNQHAVMALLLREKRYDELQEYFVSLEKGLDMFKPWDFIDSGNALVNSVVNMEIMKASSCGVSLVTRINVPQTLPFDASDFCRIVANLLDNAIEETLRAGGKDSLVDLKMNTRMDYLYISVKNKIRADADRQTLLKMNTVKEDAANHGYGHKIVKRMVDKYNGHVNYSIDGDEFVAEVMLEFCKEGTK